MPPEPAPQQEDAFSEEGPKSGLRSAEPFEERKLYAIPFVTDRQETVEAIRLQLQPPTAGEVDVVLFAAEDGQIGEQLARASVRVDAAVAGCDGLAIEVPLAAPRKLPFRSFWLGFLLRNGLKIETDEVKFVGKVSSELEQIPRDLPLDALVDVYGSPLRRPKISARFAPSQWKE